MLFFFSDILTVSGEELPEVYSDHHPFTEVVPVAPQADVHGARARLAVHAAEVEGVAGKVVRMPALTFICGEPEACRDKAWKISPPKNKRAPSRKQRGESK